MIPANTKAARPAGEWNSSVLKLKGQHFEHWINGTKVLEGSLKDPAIAAGAEKRWGKYAPMVRDILSNPKPSGPFALQHHGDQYGSRTSRSSNNRIILACVDERRFAFRRSVCAELSARV